MKRAIHNLSIRRDYCLYILLNSGLSVFSFIRSFVFMSNLDLKELGVVSLIQTIIMFISMLQIGLLNGGYRIVSLGSRTEIEKCNNVIFSYITLLFPLCMFCCYLIYQFQLIKSLSLVLLIISVVLGLFSLLSNWYNNVLVGEQKLNELNKANTFSYSLSFFLLPCSVYWGFWGAVIVLAIQPIGFIVWCYLRNQELRPSKLFYFKTNYIKHILSFGFIPFICGILSTIYLQVERWSINSVLSAEALGMYYLVFLYVSLFQLIPSSINAIFFPKCIKLYSTYEYDIFKRNIVYYYLLLIGYGVVISLVTYSLMKPFVSLLFPNHLGGIGYVYIVLPGLILRSLASPIGIILNSSLNLKSMLYVDTSELIFQVLGIIFIVITNNFTLTNISLLRTFSCFWALIGYIFCYCILRRELYPTSIRTPNGISTDSTKRNTFQQT